MPDTQQPAIDLSQENTPIDESLQKYAQLMNNLQGNILTSHGRHFAMHIFFKFKPDLAAAKAAIVALRTSGYIHSAAEQAAQTARFVADGDTIQEVFGTILFSAHGLAALGLTVPPGGSIAPGPAVNLTFAQPMRAAAAELGDKLNLWDPEYLEDIDGVLIVAYGNQPTDNTQPILDELFAQAKKAREILEKGAVVAKVETGHAHVIDNEPREHFGFVDGISQPLFRVKDIAGAGPTDLFDPAAGLINLLIADPCAPGGSTDAFASFFVFRKLEQNVKGWRAAVETTAKDLDADPGLAGAMAVGRFQNGDPVVEADAPTGPFPQPSPPNNFTYAEDVAGLKCPYHGHIRKANPRGDTDRNFGKGDGKLTPGERDRRIARRGITYGDRAPGLTDAPETGVGLLFMCYQANIADQFAFMQKNWVNNDGFGRGDPLPGQDAVIGQGSHTQAQVWADPWGGPNTKTLPDFGQFVTNKGGEFFLAVSIPTILALA
ncbi:Dyp-type peroxidase [Acidisoma cladoniae]|uniref:Dyp-type peroxidase n=1 Tax=Acidisoma cladoniae TaxID=3040935 RepID=UPI0025516A58|nr:Dyp-type peroxidase domain-containing protein [Acidisoma sp. PAMC 29798]